MRKIGLIILSTIICCVCIAQPRSESEAQALAEKFAHKSCIKIKKSSGSVGGPTLVYAAKSYYAFNTTGGYVLISSDSRLPEVLGYSDSGKNIDFDSLPANMRYWLSCYDEQMSLLTADIKPKTQTLSTTDLTTVGPLMTSTWNQNSPFNDLAPIYSGSSHAAAGCVATAAAQIMYYWKYPQKGSGSHSYDWTNSWNGSTTTLTANFGATTYDWGNMADNAKSSSPANVKQAIATLLYHVGVACNMNYASNNTSSSGAVPNVMAQALKTYFNYDTNLQKLLYRSSYSDTEFEQILKDEIDAGRPVLYSGWTTDGGGHSFVCDGYRSDGTFHINWGWGGSSDGWFVTSIMNPAVQGIGGSEGGGYSKSQQIAVGIQPPISYHKLNMDSLYVSVSQTTRSGSFYVILRNIKNYEWSSFGGTVGVALYDEDAENMLAVLKSSSQTLDSRKTTSKTLSSITIPSSYANGYYQLVGVYKDTDGVWRPITATKDNYKLVQLTSSSIEFYSDNIEPDLVLTEQISFADNNAVSHQGAVLTYKVKNNGGTFRGEIQGFIYKGKLNKGEFGQISSKKINRKSSETYKIIDNITNTPGNYNLVLKYRNSSADAWQEFTPAEYTRVAFTLLDDELPKLQMTENISFADNSSVQRSNAQLSYSLLNTGGTFNGELGVFLIKDDEEIGLQGETFKDIIIEKEATKSSVLSVNFDNSLPKGNYKLALRARNSEEDIWEDIFPTTRSVLSITLNAPTPVYNYITEHICKGEQSKYNGETEENTYTWKLTAQNGADSIVVLSLKVHPVYYYDYPVVVCSDELPYLFAGESFFETTDYTGEFTTKNGCDSIVNLKLTVLPSYKFTMPITECESQMPYSFDDKDFYESTEYVGYFKTKDECDSIVTLQLKVMPAIVNSVEMTINENDLPWTDGYITIGKDDIGKTIRESVWTDPIACEKNEYNITIISTPTAIESAETILNIYPNLVEKGDIIVLNHNFSSAQLQGLMGQIYSSTGSLVGYFSGEDIQSGIKSPLESGIYILQIQTGTSDVITAKFVVK